MTRAVLDSSVLVSSLIAPAGAPAKLVVAARSGIFDLIASPKLLAELESVLRREKFRRYADIDRVTAFLRFVTREAEVVTDPEAPPPIRCSDPKDDYLIALAHDQKAVLVSGDRHLLELAGRIPVFSPSEFLATQLYLKDG
ncbi:MAG TPA: putative toxin-antitoxin system toxin component, PIN family [Solirubrobacterales bacterium]